MTGAALDIHKAMIPGRSRPFLFDNPVLWLFFMYYLASMVNDAVPFWIGLRGLFTPRQVTILFGIFIMVFIRKSSRNRVFLNSISCLLIFYLVCAASYLVSFLCNNASHDGLMLLIKTGGNIIWLFLVGRSFADGLSRRDTRTMVGGILLLGLIPILSGLYELYIGDNILRGEWTEKGLGSFFHIRGLYIDKINYATGLAPSLLLAFFLLIVGGLKKHYYLLPYLGAGLICIFRSYSTTGILGIAGGMILVTFFYISSRIREIVLATTVASLILFLIGINTVYGQFFVKQYIDKYERLSNLDSNARYVSGAICVREFVHSPFWGLGFGNHIRLINKELSGWSGGGNAHSIVSIPADLGLLGAVPLFLFWLILYATTFRSLRRSRRQSLFEDDVYLLGLSAGLSVFVFARLLFYFHSLADEAFIIWPVIFYIANGNLIARPTTTPPADKLTASPTMPTPERPDHSTLRNT